jgi:SAM-dependent methyltransferase
MNTVAPSASLKHLNWNQIWRESRQQRSLGRRKRTDWNCRASSFARHTRTSVYAGNFISYMKLQPQWSVLDVGCGPGTLAVPLALKVQSVTAIDLSKSMIAILRDTCASKGLTNVDAREMSWEDDWDAAGIGDHDVAIASRSLAIDDLETAILKLAEKARHKVYISSLVGDGPFDRRIFEAIGRDLDRGPDFLCVYNLLNQMGILADVSFLSSNTGYKVYRDINEAVKSFDWMVADMTTEEENRLREYLRHHLIRKDHGWSLDYQHVARWAIISWRK